MSGCPNCASDNISHSGTFETLVGYSSPRGHDHNDNCLKRDYQCGACGHQWLVSKRRRCPTCDWRGKATCFCHQGIAKVDYWPEEARR